MLYERSIILRPKLRFLSDELVNKIIDEGIDIICKLGVEIHNDAVVSMLSDHGAKVDQSKKRVYYTSDIITKALEYAPNYFKLYDTTGKEAVDLSGDNVNYTPGSAAINILDYQ